MNHPVAQTAETAAPANNTRCVFNGPAEARNVTFDVARTARRALAIFTQDLEPDSYARIEFVDIVKNLVLTHKFARVRIVVQNPLKTINDGHPLVELARRCSRFVEIREVHADFQQRRDTFLIADQMAVMYRANATRLDGIADTRSPAIAVHYLEFFDTVWHHSEAPQELRELYF